MATVQLEMPKNIISTAESSMPIPSRIPQASPPKHATKLNDIHHWSDDGEVSIIRGADIPIYLDLIDDIYSSSSSGGD